MRLPPPQAQAEDKVKYIDHLEDEAMNDPMRRAWERSKQRWLDLYTGNHFHASYPVTTEDYGREPEELAPRHSSTMVQIVYNRVMNAVLAHLAAQVGNAPKVVFNARESGEPPIYYLNGYVQNPFVQQMAMQMGATDDRAQQAAKIYGSDHSEAQNAAMQAGMSVPIQEPFVTQLKEMIDAGRVASMQARQAGMPVPQNIVPPEALVEVTDQTTAQFTQTVYDALWEQCGGIEAVNENILNKKIVGWQPTLFESDRTKIDQGESPITLTNVEGSQVYYDPMTSSFRPPRYAIMREPVSVEEGCAKYPEAAAVVKQKSIEGSLGNRLLRNGRMSRLAYVQFGRDVCVIRTLWIRDWPYPMDPDEAVAQGKVQIGEVPDESQMVMADAGQPTPNGGGIPASAVSENSPASTGLATTATVTDKPNARTSDNAPTEEVASESGGTDLGTEPSGGDEGMVAGQGIAMRSAFIHSDTGEEVTPNLPDGSVHPSWPIIYGIREIRDIERVVIFDQRCRLPDIPLPPNINIPVPFSPYGIGEPDRLDGLQMAINRVLSDLITFHRYNAYPPQVTHQAVADGIGSQLNKMRLQPNSVTHIPQIIADLLGGDLSKAIQFLDVGQMSPDAWKLLEFLVDAIDKEAGNTEASQGIAPSGSSGAWVANLQSAAAQVMQVTSMSTEAWMKKIVRLIVHFISNDMTVEDIQKYTSKYPPPILEAFHKRQKALYLDIGVEIQSGSAASKQGQTSNMIQAKQAGIPISDTEIMSRMNLDPDSQLKQQGDFNQKKLETGAVEMPQDQPANSPA